MSFIEGLGEIVVEFFGNFLFEYLIQPLFKNIGVSLRWLLNLGQKKYSELYDKGHNTLLGFIIVIATVLLYIYCHFK